MRIGKNYDDCNFVIAHLGGGISIGAQRNGKMVDVNNANDEGPFSPERSGEMPIGDVVKMAYSGDYTKQELKRLFTKNSGLKAYLNTNDLLVAYEQAKSDPKALQVIEAMAYQIAKEIGGMCAVLQGKIELYHLDRRIGSQYRFCRNDKGIRFPVFGLVAVVPGENELEALATGWFKGPERE